jgi:hypothetical protein
MSTATTVTKPGTIRIRMMRHRGIAVGPLFMCEGLTFRFDPLPGERCDFTFKLDDKQRVVRQLLTLNIPHNVIN